MTFYVFWQRKPLQVSTCHELGVSIFLTPGVQSAKFLFYPVKENIQQPGLFFIPSCHRYCKLLVLQKYVNLHKSFLR